MALSGHLRTVGWRLVRGLRTASADGAVPWSTEVDDPALGPVRLSGWLHHPPGARDLLVVVHGLGGCSESSYAVRAARVSVASGVACLRFNLRGADRSGEDYYHAGLTDDLGAALASPELAGYRNVSLLGFSLGGHVALRYATEGPDPRLRGVAAVCAPLDLAAGGRLIDRPAFWPYRRYLFRSLVEIYGAVARRRPVPLPVEAARRILSFGPDCVLVKGGHLPAEEEAVDVLYDGEELVAFRAPRLDQRHTHGTGCTYSAAIAAGLAKGLTIRESVHRAKAYITEAIRTAPGLGGGVGPLNHFAPVPGGTETSG